VTFHVKVLRKEPSRRWYVENVAVIAASSEEDAIAKVRGFYPRKGKAGIRRSFKIVDSIKQPLRGCHGTIRSSIGARENVNPKRILPV